MCLSSQRSSLLVLASFRSHAAGRHHEDARLFINEAVVSFILDKRGTEENYVVKLSPEGASQLV